MAFVIPGRYEPALSGRIYRGLGQTLPVVKGTPQLFDGSTSWQLSRLGAGSEEECRAWLVKEQGTTTYAVGQCVPSADRGRWDVQWAESLMRADGTPGLQMYVPDLIPTTGGFLPGYVILNGNVSGITPGVPVTLEGTWQGSRPNNLCVNCGWAFFVSRIITGEAPPGSGTGALDQNDPAMVEERKKAIAAQEAAARKAAEEAARKAAEQGTREPKGPPGEPGTPGTPEVGIPKVGDVDLILKPGPFAGKAGTVALAGLALLLLPGVQKRRGDAPPRKSWGL